MFKFALTITFLLFTNISYAINHIDVDSFAYKIIYKYERSIVPATPRFNRAPNGLSTWYYKQNLTVEPNYRIYGGGGVEILLPKDINE